MKLFERSHHKAPEWADAASKYTQQQVAIKTPVAVTVSDWMDGDEQCLVLCAVWLAAEAKQQPQSDWLHNHRWTESAQQINPNG